MSKITFPFLVFSCLLRMTSLCAAGQAINPPPDDRFRADLLLVVAHPDDETEIGAYLARAIFDEKKRVAVVFGTRGNGGGNAEGQEQAASLGAIREIEARQALAHFDVSHVWFLNGTDTPGQEVLSSLETWDHGDSLERLVRLVRLTRPAVIVTWLPDWVAGENHGDHQAAGVLATEAFDSAGDPTVFAEQLATPRNRRDIRNLTEGLRPWQPQKIYYVSDAAHTEFLRGQGPSYSATDVSPAKGVSYAKLAAEECAFHLTQDDTGQMARTALAKGDLKYFEQPVLFVSGKSLVDSQKTADLFAGVKPTGISFQHAVGFSAEVIPSPHIELGDPWLFYRKFWQAHGITQLTRLVGPEIMAGYNSFFQVPVVLDNPTAQSLDARFTVDLPEGWTFRQPLPSSITIGPNQTATLPLEFKTGSQHDHAWKTISIDANAGAKNLGKIRIRVKLDAGAMPQ
ncbi:MAG TPA: PIG-L family deacetylase [Bryobacteraceae bacterium]|nr:PIG-L family deacetylase [Bryobacteraceae bacterium]